MLRTCSLIGRRRHDVISCCILSYIFKSILKEALSRSSSFVFESANFDWIHKCQFWWQIGDMIYAFVDIDFELIKSNVILNHHNLIMRYD